MSIKTGTERALNEYKTKLMRKFLPYFLKRSMRDYKVRRKDTWQSFKNKMNAGISKIEKSIK